MEIKLDLNNCSINIREAIALDSGTQKEVLKILAVDDEVRVRMAVLKNPNTSSEVLKCFINEKETEIIINIAKHHQTPIEVLETFCNNNNNNNLPYLEYIIKIAIAKHKDATIYMLEKLANEKSRLIVNTDYKNWNPYHYSYIDAHSVVRSAVAMNKNTPLYLLKKLADDEDENVRMAVIERFKHFDYEDISGKLPECFLDIHHKDLDLFFVSSENVLTTILRKIYDKYRNGNYLDRCAILSELVLNRNCPPDIFMECARDKYDEVRRFAAYSQNVSMELLIEMAGDEYDEVRSTAIYRLKSEYDYDYISEYNSNCLEYLYKKKN